MLFCICVYKTQMLLFPAFSIADFTYVYSIFLHVWKQIFWSSTFFQLNMHFINNGSRFILSYRGSSLSRQLVPSCFHCSLRKSLEASCLPCMLLDHSHKLFQFLKLLRNFQSVPYHVVALRKTKCGFPSSI